MNIWQKMRKSSGQSFEVINQKTDVPINTLKNIESRMDQKKLNPDYVCKLSEYYSTLSGCKNYETDYLTLMHEAGYTIPEKYSNNKSKNEVSNSEKNVIRSFDENDREMIKLFLFFMKHKRELLEIFEDRENFNYYLWHKEEIIKWIDQS